MSAGKSRLEQLTQREYALMAAGFGAVIYALLPFLLHLAGTRWKPGVPVTDRTRIVEEANKREKISL